MSTDNLLLDKIFELVLQCMEAVEKEPNLRGSEKSTFVLNKMKAELEDIYELNEDTIINTIEVIIFLSKLRRKVKINQISKNCADCFSFL